MAEKKKEGKKGIRVTYLGHSGFLAELPEASLVFDCCRGKLPELRPDRPLLVFVSHGHPDHYQRSIFEWRKKYADVTYVFSSDTCRPFDAGNVIRMEPHQVQKIGPCLVRTLRSTDEGVAFITECGGVRLYHAGDLNWWHWEEEDASYNAQMKRDYLEEIGRIEGERFDAAFVPVDKRLEKTYFLGLDAFMRHTDTRNVFPMHFWDRYEVWEDLMRQPETADYRDRIRKITEKGEVFEI